MNQKRIFVLLVVVGLLIANAGWAGAADDREIEGIKFPSEVVVEGKTLQLNGVALTKAFGVLKVCVDALYLEKPTTDANAVIESEQVKQVVTQYIMSKITISQLQSGIIKEIGKLNPPELATAHKQETETYAKWMDKDMKTGLGYVCTYVPGKGLTLAYQGETKGTIPGKEFAQMIFRYNVGEKVDKGKREGLLGILPTPAKQ